MTGVVHNWCWIIQQVVAGELTEWSRKREYQSKELMMPIISRRMMLMKVKVTCMMMVELCASLEPATSKQESQEQSRYLFLIRESGASLVEICYRHHFQFYEAHSAFASCEFGHCDSHICQQKDIELLRTYFIYYTLKFLVSCWRWYSHWPN